jgi:hypothetical protein
MIEDGLDPYMACEYPQCDRSFPHLIAACTRLMGGCQSCHTRGHVRAQCSSVDIATHLANFECYANKGALTRQRFTKPEWGFYVGVTGLSPVPKYEDLLMMTPSAVLSMIAAVRPRPSV